MLVTGSRFSLLFAYWLTTGCNSKRLRAMNSFYRNSPIVALSATAHETVRRVHLCCASFSQPETTQELEVTEMGFNELLCKPYTQAQLLDVVHRFCRH